MFIKNYGVREERRCANAHNTPTLKLRSLIKLKGYNAITFAGVISP